MKKFLFLLILIPSMSNAMLAAIARRAASSAGAASQARRSCWSMADAIERDALFWAVYQINRGKWAPQIKLTRLHKVREDGLQFFKRVGRNERTNAERGDFLTLTDEAIADNERVLAVKGSPRRRGRPPKCS